MSATAPLVVFTLWIAVSIFMADFQSALMGGAGARHLETRNIEERDISPFWIASHALLLALHCYLFAKRGHDGLNRFGAPSL
jgi:predicted nucleic acid-binding protein